MSMDISTITLDEGLPDDAAREQRRRYILRLIGTKATPAIESQRAMMAVDWMLRVYTPTWLDRLPALRMHAAALRAHPEIVDTAGLISVLPIAGAARRDAAAAWAATRDTDRAAARDAARAVVWTALQPTVTDLQASAHDLYDRMIRCGQEAGNATPAA